RLSAGCPRGFRLDDQSGLLGRRAGSHRRRIHRDGREFGERGDVVTEFDSTGVDNGGGCGHDARPKSRDEEILMSRFREEMKVIPRGAWIIAILLYLFGLGCSWFVFFPRDEKFEQWPAPAVVIFGGIVPLFLMAYVLLLGYVNADARRRGMRHV